MAQTTLGDVLLARGMQPAGMLAFRLSLNPADRGDGYRTMADLAQLGVALAYARMQDGQRFGAEARIALCIAEDGLLARLAGCYTFKARRPGIAPGDIVYDYDAAHLLHSFIARARRPTFYDAFELADADDAGAHRRFAWPKPAMRQIIRADDPRLLAVAADRR